MKKDGVVLVIASILYSVVIELLILLFVECNQKENKNCS